VLFLLLAQLAVYQRLSATRWTSDLELAGLMAVIGVVLGLALGSSRFKPAAVLGLALGYSLAVYPLLMGGLLGNGTPWLGRLAALGGRLAFTFSLFITHKPVQDPILFVTFMAVCYWVVSLIAGFSLARAGNFLGAVLPGGIVLFIIQVYDPKPASRVAFLAVYLLFCLLLLGRLTFVRKRQFWKEHQVWFSSESASEMNRATLIMAALLILLTWLAPVSSQSFASAQSMWNDLTQPFEQTRKDLGNAIAGLQSNPSAPTLNFYPADLTLGGQAANGSDLVFTVRLPAVAGATRYYWRVRTYDQYQNGAWQTTATADNAVPPDRRLDVPDLSGLKTSNFYFYFPQQGIATLITPTRALAVSRPSLVTYFAAQDGQVDPVVFKADPPLPAGQSYRVQAVVANPTVVELRAAGTDYPAWVADRYLQLPADLPPTIPALAQRITAGLTDPYDKAQAVTQYLRDNIQYVKAVPPAPQGQDMLAWFLFTFKAGYCNYYATAEVILLRATGVPARMAVGYAEGTQEAPYRVTVLQEDAHAWPEVYFPGLGWVEFEPTVSQPPLERPSGGVSTGPAGLSTQQAEQATQSAGAEGLATGAGPGAPMDPVLRIILIVTALGIVVALVWIGSFFGPGVWITARLERVFRRPLPVIAVQALEKLSLPPPGWLVHWAFLTNLSPVTRSFGVVYQGLRRLGVQTSPAQTPAEAARALAGSLPAATGDLRILLDQYQRSMYSQQSGDWSAARRAADAVRRQSLLAVLRIRLAAFKRLFRKTP